VNTTSLTRRRFSQLGAQGLLVGGVSTCLPVAAWAQAGFPAEGLHFSRLAQPQPVPGGGKVDVLEFFWYGCSHCAALDPEVVKWTKTLPADVAFRRVPVGFRPTHEFHARLYYALEALGAPEAVHAKVFTAIHGERKQLTSDEQVVTFASTVGLDGAKLVATMKSFAVAGKAGTAKKLTQDYNIDGVPTFAVQGRHLTSVGQAGSPAALFQVLGVLIDRARKAGR
jgi:thiol:disulfide interchange protein DsbA